MKSRLPLFVLPLLFVGCASHQHIVQQPTVTPDPNKPKIALVLGGGGTRGFAHIGVIETLEAHNIKPDIIIGTSSGAMVGAIYASGKSAKELRQIALSVQDDELLDITPSKQGLIEGQKLATFINKHVNHTTLEDLPIHFLPIATDMHTKTAVAFSTGDTGQAVRASASVPKLFIPPRLPQIGGKKYVDGGQSALVPARFAKALGADIVISVDLLGKTAHTHPLATGTPNPQTARIARTDKGVSATWGSHTMDIPLDLTTLNNRTLPFGIRLGDELDALISQLPTQASLDIPPELTTLAQGKQGFWQLFANIGTTAIMAKEDEMASNVIIRPDLSEFAVFDSHDKEGMILAGQVATKAQINAIQAKINTYTPKSQW